MQSARRLFQPGWPLILGSLVAMAWLDYVTGQEIVFSAAYLLPVALSAWRFGRRGAIAMALVAGCVALLVDEFDGSDYSQHWIEYWNAFMCLFMSLVTGLVFARLRQSIDRSQEMNRILADALDKLCTSTAEIRKLQSGLQTVCAWTNRIKVGEEWMTADEFLKTQLHLELTHGISPQALEKIQEDAARIGQVA